MSHGSCISIYRDVLPFYSHIFQLLVVCQLMLCIYMIGITFDLFNEAMPIYLLPGVTVDSYSSKNAGIKCWFYRKYILHLSIFALIEASLT